MRVCLGFLCFALVAFLATPASAATKAGQVYSEITASEVASIMEIAGYPVKHGTDSQGDPMIESKADRITFTVYFYACTAGSSDGAPKSCKELQLAARLTPNQPVALQKINAWNKKQRYLKAYGRDEEANGGHRDVALNTDINLTGGVTAANIAAWLRRYQRSTHEFADFIAFWTTPLPE